MSSQSRISNCDISYDSNSESNSVIDEAAGDYELAEHLFAEHLFAGLSGGGFSGGNKRGVGCIRANTRIKAKRIQQEEEKKQAIKIEQAAKQCALLAQPSKNRGGKNLRKKSARTAFVLEEQTEIANEVPTELLHTQQPDKVSLKRAMRKPGHGARGKLMRFSESESTGSSEFKSLEYMIDIYEEELRKERD